MGGPTVTSHHAPAEESGPTILTFNRDDYVLLDQDAMRLIQYQSCTSDLEAERRTGSAADHWPLFSELEIPTHYTRPRASILKPRWDHAEMRKLQRGANFRNEKHKQLHELAADGVTSYQIFANSAPNFSLVRIQLCALQMVGSRVSHPAGQEQILY